MTSVYVARVLMSEGIGIVASAQNVVSYFTIIASLGIPTYGIKKIAENKDNVNSLSKTFFELLIINSVSTILCTVCYFLLVSTSPFFAERKALYIICGLNIVFNIFNIDWFYQGIEEYRYIMIRSMIIKIVSLLMLFIAVKESSDYLMYALISSLALVVNYCFNIFHARTIIKLPNKKLDITQHLKPVFILLGAVIAVEIYTLADISMLSLFCGDEVVGLYTNSMKIIKIVRSLVVAICAVFLPRLSYYYSKGEKDRFNRLIDRGVKILFCFSMPAAIGLVLVANDMIPILFGSSFIESVTTTRILSLSVITVAFSNFFGHQILITIGKENVMMLSTIMGAIINVALNAILIPLYSLNGAAIASIITETGVAIFQIVYVMNVIDIRFHMSFLKSTFISLIAMTLCVIIIEYSITNVMIKIIMSIIIGAVVYVGVLIYSKNEVGTLVFNKMLKRYLTVFSSSIFMGGIKNV